MACESKYLESLSVKKYLNRVHLIWLSGHEGIEGSETADQLGTIGSLISSYRT
jgi:ribonuclease HI